MFVRVLFVIFLGVFSFQAHAAALSPLTKGGGTPNLGSGTVQQPGDDRGTPGSGPSMGDSGGRDDAGGDTGGGVVDSGGTNSGDGDVGGYTPSANVLECGCGVNVPDGVLRVAKACNENMCGAGTANCSVYVKENEGLAVKFLPCD